jgi:hypothetical protein
MLPIVSINIAMYVYANKYLYISLSFNLNIIKINISQTKACTYIFFFLQSENMHFCTSYSFINLITDFLGACDWDLNSGLHTWKASALLLESHLQFFLFWLFFWRWGLVNNLHRLASKCNPPDLSLTSS